MYWRIELFGRLRAIGPAGEIIPFSTSRTSALLARLAFKPGWIGAREVLAEELWPEIEGETARHRLRQSLVSLRQRLEPTGVPPETILLAGREGIFLQTALVTSDTDEFETAYARAKRLPPAERLVLLDRACALYTDHLLPAYQDDWVIMERERFRGMAFEALQQMTDLLIRSGDLSRARDYARRAADMDPLHEGAGRELMRLLAEDGQVSAARRRFLRLKKALKQELGVAPEAGTRALFRHLPVALSPPVAPRSNPPPSSPSLPPDHTRLPSFLTRFFGRDAEIEQILSLMHQPHTRVVTLTGIGGVGKTRLAVEAARAFKRDCIFLSLADLSDPALIWRTVCLALGLPLDGNLPPQEQAIRALTGRSVLLILDNLEQFPDSGVGVITEMLARLPLLSLLTTSRRSLGLSGDQELSVLPLHLPPAGATPDALYTLSSTRLFTDRMQSVRPGFQITARNADSVAVLCRRLDGLPLALELAASWGRTMTPAQMLPEIDRRFGFLVSRSRDVTPRHQSLQAVVQWSLVHLPPEVQRFFAALSVFRGGWTLDAAATVCAEPGATVAEWLAELSEHCLITATEAGDQMRYGLLETLREYGHEQLSAPEQETLSRRHARFCQTFAEQNAPRWDRAVTIAQLGCINAEYSNFRHALDWCRGSTGGKRRKRDDAEVGLRLANALHRYWLMGDLNEGNDQLKAALAAAPYAPDALLARAWIGLGRLSYLSSGSETGIRLLARGMALYRQEQNPNLSVRTELGSAFCQISHLLLSSDRPQRSAICLDAGRHLLQGTDQPHELAEAAFYHANWCFRMGQLDRVEPLYREAAALYRRAGNLEQESSAISELGYLALWQGRYQEAEKYLTQGRDFSRAAGVPQGSHSDWLLGIVAAARGDYAQAETLIGEALAQRLTHGVQDAAADVLVSLGDVFLTQGRYEDAERAYGEADAMAGANAAPDVRAWQRMRWGRLEVYRGRFEQARAWLDPSRLAVPPDWRLAGLFARFRGLRALFEGAPEARELLTLCLAQRRATGQRRGIAEGLEDFALVAMAEGNPERAALLWGAADAYRRELGAPMPPCDHGRHTPAQTEARRTLGEMAYTHAFRAGKDMSLDALLNELLQENSPG